MSSEPWSYGSATQVDNYSSCERKWWYQSVQKLGKDESYALSFGTDVHAIIECGLKGGDPATGPYSKDAFALARVALAHDGWLMTTVAGRTLSSESVEIEFEDKETFAAPVRGKIDLLLFDVYEEEKRVHVRIIDHKTTKNRRYILGTKRLRKNIQGLLYANHVFSRFEKMFPGYEITIEFFLHYLIKEEDFDTPVVSSVVYSEADLATGKAMINELLEKMHADSRKTIQDDVLTRPSACAKYGGCPFKNRCFGFAAVEVDPTKEQEMQDFWNALDKTGKNPSSSKPIVFVDCMPYNHEVVSAEAWLKEEITAYETKTKMPYLASPYNEGVKVIVAQAIGSKKPLPERLHISSISPVGSLLIAALKDSDVMLVFGMR